MSVRQRVVGAFVLLLVLFLSLVFVQLMVGDRLRDEHTVRADGITRAREANRAVLQFMTDAETGVRGFQLTGRPRFLEPYESGRAAAFSALATVEEDRDSEVRRLVSEERAAVSPWLYAYAIPIVNAGTADTDEGRAERGKELFDRFRTANADVDAGIATEQDNTAAADRGQERTAQLLFAGLAVLILATGLGAAVLHQRSGTCCTRSSTCAARCAASPPATSRPGPRSVARPGSAR